MDKYIKFYGFGSLMLFAFLQGATNVYIGGIGSVLKNTYHFHQPILSTLTASLFLGNGLGCIIGGSLVDRYGAGTLTSICGIITIIGMMFFIINDQQVYLTIAEFIIGLGVSLWYPAGIQVLKINFESATVPLLAGIFLLFNILGSATISIYISISDEYGLIDTDYFMMALTIFIVIYIFITAHINNPDKNRKPPKTSLISAYKDQLLLMKNRIVIPCIIAQSLPSIFNYAFLPLWAIPYIGLLLTKAQAEFIVSITLVVYGISGAVLGSIYYRFFTPLGWMMVQYGGSFIFFGILLFLPFAWVNFWIVCFCLCMISVLLGANNTYIAIYLADLFEPKYTGTISAVYNYMLQIIISISIPVFGWMLKESSADKPNTITDYTNTLYYLLLVFALSTITIVILKYYTRSYPKQIKINS